MEIVSAASITENFFDVLGGQTVPGTDPDAQTGLRSAVCFRRHDQLRAVAAALGRRCRDRSAGTSSSTTSTPRGRHHAARLLAAVRTGRGDSRHVDLWFPTAIEGVPTVPCCHGNRPASRRRDAGADTRRPHRTGARARRGAPGRLSHRRAMTMTATTLPDDLVRDVGRRCSH